MPYSSLESVVEQSKEAYYLALRQTQGTIRTESPNWQPWLVFFLRSLAEQVRRLEKKIEREKLVLASMPELSLQIVEFAREHGRVTIGQTIKLTGASRNTLKQHFRALVERGTEPARQRPWRLVRLALIGMSDTGSIPRFGIELGRRAWMVCSENWPPARQENRLTVRSFEPVNPRFSLKSAGLRNVPNVPERRFRVLSTRLGAGCHPTTLYKCPDSSRGLFLA